MTMSLDGLSTGGEGDLSRIHDWIIGATGPVGRSAGVVADYFATTGSWVMGRRAFESGLEPWGPEPPFAQPTFVVTNQKRDPLIMGATTFNFVAGVATAVAEARQAAGDSNVTVIGGADIATQCLNDGLIDELEIHVVPLLLGTGTRLFDRLELEPTALQITEVIDTPEVTHIRYAIKR
ncbi:dihydrofolate reductase family protein [Nocardia sp. NPDC004573]